MEIDIHSMAYLQAKKYLEKEIIRLNKLGYKRLVIVHGYRKGQVLKKLVINDLRSNLIKERNPGIFNLGQTELILK